MKMLIKMMLVATLMAVVCSADARPIGRSPYAPPAKPEPFYDAPVTTRVPDTGSAASLFGLAALSLAAARLRWRTY